MRLLDLFCGAGGAAMGYYRAGFRVTGVDITRQKNYPFEFHEADALAFVRERGREYDAVHASPPCQAYSVARRRDRAYQDLYRQTRDAITALGVPWVIENVVGAPYRYGVLLCGSMFGVPMHRHRNFETSMLILQPACAHQERPFTITGHARVTEERDYGHSRQCSEAQARTIMGIDWMTWAELVQAVPPSYTEWIGRHVAR